MRIRNGFTFIELLTVIALIAVVGTIVSINLVSSFNETKERACTNFVKEIEDAACVYIGLANKKITCTRSSCPDFSINYLVEAGLINSEKNMCNNEDLNLNDTVSVSWSIEGEKKCIYNGVKEYER